MNEITFDEFYKKYGVKRNPVQLVSNYQNTMLDVDEDELDELEEHSLDNQWTLLEGEKELILCPGRHIENAIGFFICKEKWNKNQGEYILR